MDKIKFSEIFEYQKKSKIKAGEGLKLNKGKYPLYTSSKKLSKSFDEYLFSNTSLVFGTGGLASIHYINEKFAVSTDCLVAQVKEEEKENVLIKHVYYYLSGNIHLLEEGFKGAGLKHISRNFINDLKIPLPPLAEQKRIAAILDEADKLRQLDKQILKNYDTLSQSLFLDMFGDPVTNPMGWETKKFGEFSHLKAGKFVTASEIASDQDSGMYPCYGGGNGLRGYVESFTHEGVYVLIGRQGALCGNVKIVEGVFHATEHAIVCSPKMDYNAQWLYYLLYLSNLNKYATGAAQPGLNVGKLVELSFMFPPIDLQTEFVQRIQAIEAQKKLASAAADKSESLFQALLQKAFKGEL